MKVALKSWTGAALGCAEALGMSVQSIGLEVSAGGHWRAYVAIYGAAAIPGSPGSDVGPCAGSGESDQEAADNLLLQLRERLKKRIAQRKEELRRLESAHNAELRLVPKETK